MAHLLITGGAGFIGSHTCLVLLQAGHSLVVLDNFDNSSPLVLQRVTELAAAAGALPEQHLQLVEGDIRKPADLERAFASTDANGAPIAGVIHFAGLKAVGESVQQPLRYWDVNVNGSRLLLDAMQRHGCLTIVFSSTSTVYGEPQTFPIDESCSLQPLHPYAQSKVAVEWMLEALERSEAGWCISRLRYFNPVGAHPSGQIGEDPRGIPNNLFPFISQVASGQRAGLQIFGNDWPTPDGTGIRDYLHVMDLAEAHQLAIEALLQHQRSLPVLNLGTGRGLSVLEIVAAFEAETGIAIPHTLVARRQGDVPRLEACADRAAATLGWRARRSLADMCRDGWAWQRANPQGYGG
ncbi:MAG: UDP-glucose 4-epimerase GalE [Cyanobacteria bacterium K_DeepCast_35m_m2_023]|nr:UDP-glucose 4-epimerase GalE [Cyanobacteria bacterium K_DeepCast_35m_m2_023]